ncbi:non-ribosomal peptide synthetase [Nitrococcus mobilis]|uniref:Peptide synthase n=1 Tax=Nitrococcus mobilis Nb-231 TaxID=314278 RepID=A4BRH1_9GAMM|nr:non-ribosomal peptide synthetase [Nitrococcus mobilis]EAR21793.1 peptide synthase [Nitrococcus mobilis Nb-231]
MTMDAALGLAQRFIDLSPEKKRVFFQQLRKQDIDFSLLPIPSGIAGKDHTRVLSYAQSRLWFLWQLEPQSSAYNVPGAIRLKGELDIGALGKAFDFLVKRHEVLRTTFHRTSGEVIQTVQLPAPIELDREDLGEACARVEERERRVIELAEAEAGGAFDLERGPLLRVRLLRLGAREHVLLVTLHHIVCDAWSMEVLVEEFARAYAAYRQGEAPELAALPIQYADYALWQRQWMEAGEGERQLAYWRAQLGEHHPVLELPTDRARRAVPSERGRRYDFALEAELVQRLRALARAHEVTLPMLLLAAFKVLLYRYTGQGDLRVGVPIANRHRVETEGLIGFFVNTQVWRTPLDGGVRVVELLGRVRETALGAQAHQDLPFEQLVEALQPARSLSHNPLFQVMYNHQARSAAASIELRGLRIEALSREVGSTQFDLTLDTLEEGGGLSAALTYRTELFDHATVARLAGHWCELLRAMLADPERRVGELPMLPEAERFELLDEWNRTQHVYPFARGYVGLFEDRVAEHPQRLAASCQGQDLSYGQLNAQANRLGHGLIAAGVRPDDVVALFAERGLGLLGLIIGVFKAGGGYLPLDPRQPVRRLAQMLDLSRARVVVSTECLRAVLEQALAELPAERRPIWLTLEALSGQDWPVHDPGVRTGPHHLAYVIYTSGSTGVPKGVMVEQAGMLNNQLSKVPYLGLTEGDVIAQTAAAGFDISVWQFLTGLLCGARVEIVPDAIAHDPMALLKHVNATGITVLESVPSLIQGMLAEEAVELKGLRWLLPTGEALAPELARQWFRRYPHIPLVNAYGPAECSDDVALHTLREGPASGTVHLPIGRPTDNTRLYVLDGQLQPVPVGVTGELCIAGAGVGRGYLHDPARTAQAFVPHPYAQTPGERLYRSGDLARWRADGVLEYVGRSDHQVKVRGFRIELGEIEARLLEHQGVREAVVVVREAPSGKHLVGYVVPTALEAGAGLGDALKAHLKEAIPEYMVPGQIVVLEQLPLTPNGKLDRKALPEPEWESRDYVAPQTELEHQLAGIWQELLGVKRISMTDNFFELGGDSILIIQVVSRARRFGIGLAPRDLFQHQTLEALARVAQPAKEAAIDQGPVAGEVALTPIQSWFFEMEIPQRHHWNQSVLLKMWEALDPSSLEHVLRQLVVHHDALRLRYRQAGGRWIQSHVSLEDERQRWQAELLLWVKQARDAEEIRRIADEAQRSLSLIQGPLLRGVHISLPDGTARLLLVAHHLVTDGVSWRILLEDLQTAHIQLLAGQEIDLPAKTSAFKTWSEKLTTYACSESLKDELPYWMAQLGGGIEDLPQDRPWGENLVKHAGNLSLRLDRERTRQLLKQAPAAYGTQINDLLLAALARVLCRWGKRKSVLVELEGHGREDLFGIDVSRTVGWFTTAFPVRLTPRGAIADSIEAVQEQLRSVPNRGLGYGVLRYLGEPQVRAQLQTLSPPRITFNYLGQFDQSFDEGGLFVPAPESGGSGRSEDAPLTNWLEVNGRVYGGELKLTWSFSKARYCPATVQGLIEAYRAELVALIEHCTDRHASGLVLSGQSLAQP